MTPPMWMLIYSISSAEFFLKSSAKDGGYGPMVKCGFFFLVAALH